MKDILEGIEAGILDSAPLSVTYSDLHPFWGGSQLTIQGGEIDHEDLLKLLRFLLHHQAWIQLVPEGTLVPDESRPLLTTRYQDRQTSIWERHTDLSKNQRIVQIHDLMQEIARRTAIEAAESVDPSSSRPGVPPCQV